MGGRRGTNSVAGYQKAVLVALAERADIPDPPPGIDCATVRTPIRRLSWAPLEAYWKGAHEKRSDLDMAVALNVSPKELSRWKHEGLHERRAEAIACHALGVHPSAVWAEEWDAGPADLATWAAGLLVHDAHKAWWRKCKENDTP